MAGGEVLARPGEHDHLDVVVLDGAVERGVERVRHLAVLRVAVLRPIHRDDREGAAALVAHGRIGSAGISSHGVVLSSSSNSVAIVARWSAALPQSAARAQARLANRCRSYSTV